MDQEKELELIKELLIISLIKQDVSYEAISKATGVKSKTLKNRYPLKMVNKSNKEGD
jgi:hypothetical protein